MAIHCVATTQKPSFQPILTIDSPLRSVAIQDGIESCMKKRTYQIEDRATLQRKSEKHQHKKAGNKSNDAQNVKELMSNEDLLMLPTEEACMVPSHENGDQQWVAHQDSISCCAVRNVPIGQDNSHERRSVECMGVGKAISNVTLELKP
ncbi:hypothetical protein EDD85DRAFT_798037 [Armillaria nabsnona]|nr:hypothetical protein EDD85DRAFT_798037 [Armillaria nabsnona]